MMRLLLVVVVLISLAASGVFFLLENPDRFKSQITQLTERSTGYRMTIDGELSWRYWPPIAINVNDVSLARGDEAPFAEFETMSVDVDLMPLLTQQTVIDVNDVTLDGGRIELIIDAEGQANWEIATTPVPAAAQTEGQEASALAGTVQQLSVRNVTLVYQDKTANTDYEVTLHNLTTSELASDKPFDMSLALSLKDNEADMSAEVSSTGRVSFQSDTGRANLSDLVTSIELVMDGQPYPALTLTTDAHWRPDENALVLNRNNVQVSSLRMDMTGLVSLAGASPRFDGVIKMESADAARLGKDFDTELPIEFFQFESDFGATPDTLSFRTLDGNFDNTDFKGSAVVSLGTPMMIKTDLRMNRINPANYLAETGEAGESNAPATKSQNRSDVPPDSEVIPLEMLKGTHADATIRIGNLKYEDYLLTKTKLTIKNDGRRLDVIGNTNVHDGKVVFTVNSQLRERPVTDITLNIEGVDVAKLIEMPGITGIIAANSDLSFDGSMLSDINNNLTGQSRFNVKDGSLDVRPLKSVAQTVDMLRGKTSSISEWPDIMPFNHMVGQHVFQQGTRTGQILNAEIENLSITALGGLDLQAETLDYDVTAMFKQTETGAFKVSKQMAGIRWPLSCSGSINAAPGELCFGKDGAIQDLVTDIIAQDVKRRGSEKLDKLIEEKVPDEYKDIANDLLKNIFK